MKVDFAFICDYAEIAGKINALGIGFDRIYAPQVPCKQHHFSLVIQLRATVVEAGQKSMEIHLIDEDGHDVIPAVKGQFVIPKGEGTIESLGRVLMEFGNVEFKRYGSYSLRAVIEGIEMVEVPFRVSPPPTGSASS